MRKLVLLFLIFLFCSTLQAQELEIKCEKMDRSVSIKMRGRNPSARVIVFSTVEMTYNSNMGDINMKRIGRSTENGIFTDTLLFYLPSTSLRRRITMSAYGYYPSTSSFNFKPKETYHCKVVLPAKISTVASDNISKEEEYFKMAENCEFGKEGFIRSETEAMLWYRKAAENGFAEAQYVLGKKYETGGETYKADEDKAFAYLLLAAEQNHLKAQFEIANYYLAEEDFNNTFKWMREAADNGMSEAQFFIATSLLYGENGVEQNAEQALIWLRKAAKNKNTEAALLLGQALFEGYYTEADKDAAIAYLQQATDDHSVNAAIYLANIYLDKSSDYYNEQSANEILKKIDYLSDPVLFQSIWIKKMDAIMDTAEIYYHGVEGKPNYEKALYLFREGAKMSNNRAVYGLALSSYEGKGVKKEARKAKELLIEVLTLSQPDDTVKSNASILLGDYYKNTNHVDHDINKAMYYYAQAAAAPFYAPVAQNKLGILLLENPITKMDGLKLIKNAALQGYVPARFNIAYHIATDYKALGATKEGKEAVRQLRILALEGHKPAMIALSEDWAFNNGVTLEEADNWRKRTILDGEDFYIALYAEYKYLVEAEQYAYDFENRIKTKTHAAQMLLRTTDKGCSYGYRILVDYYRNININREKAIYFRNKLISLPPDEQYLSAYTLKLLQ